ncbi:hypothetical protein HanIR_Chr10g0466631 [Helianthus annuus]|nr:hypothetical protein HanIR_Chr10g0466631 [Helianthus annuus]
MTTRFYHLISEMVAYGVVSTQQDMVNKFADALPPKWSSFIELLKHTGTLDTVNIYEFIQKLEHKNDEEIRKAKRAPVPQNTEMYLPGFDALARSNAAQQPKLQTAFVSNTSSFRFLNQLLLLFLIQDHIFQHLKLTRHNPNLIQDLTSQFHLSHKSNLHNNNSRLTIQAILNLKTLTQSELIIQTFHTSALKLLRSIWKLLIRWSVLTVVW